MIAERAANAWPGLRRNRTDGLTENYFNVFRYAIKSARCLVSARPEKGITLPGIIFCGAARYASSDLSSHVMLAIEVWFAPVVWR